MVILGVFVGTDTHSRSVMLSSIEGMRHPSVDKINHVLYFLVLLAWMTDVYRLLSVSCSSSQVLLATMLSDIRLWRCVAG